MTINVVVPQIGEAISELTIVAWHKQEGDHVQVGELLFEVDSDKAIVAVEAFVEGMLSRILAPAGSAVMPQDVVALVEPAAAVSVPADPAAAEEKANATRHSIEHKPAKVTPVARRVAQDLGLEPEAIPATHGSHRIMADDVRVFARQHPQVGSTPALLSTARRVASPKAKRLAREYGLNLVQISGTGIDHMVVERDIRRELQHRDSAKLATSALRPNTTATEAIQIVADDRVPLSRARQTIAMRMQASKQTVPHFYLMLDVDMSAAQSLRTYCREVLRWERAPTYTDLMVRACGLALRAVPAMNMSYVDEQLVRHRTANIGIAVSTEDGLLVPVLSNADTMALQDVSAQVRDITERARQRRLTASDLSAKSMVVSNLGMYGIDAFVAIIDVPDPMILAVGRISDRVVPLNGQVVIRPICTLTLSVDHRAVDGAQAAQFLQRIQTLFEQPFDLLR